jgi:hypothetical protein
MTRNDATLPSAKRPAMTPPVRLLLRVTGVVVVAYLAAAGTVLGASPAVGNPLRVLSQLVGLVIPLSVGAALARRFPPAQALARLGGFAAVAAICAAVAAGGLANILLEDPANDTARFVAGTVVFVGLLVLLAAGAGAGASRALSRQLTSSAPVATGGRS